MWPVTRTFEKKKSQVYLKVCPHETLVWLITSNSIYANVSELMALTGKIPAGSQQYAKLEAENFDVIN